MMDFIVIPLVVGIITFGVYKFFELIVCRRERLNIIDRLESSQLIDYLKQVPMGLRYGAPEPCEAFEYRPRVSTGGLRVGVSSGRSGTGTGDRHVDETLVRTGRLEPVQRAVRRLGAAVRRGVGLLVSFIVEMRLSRRK